MITSVRLLGIAAAAALAVSLAPQTAAADTVILTAHDNGRTVTVHPADIIVESLQGDGGNPALAWSAPTSSDGQVLRQLYSSAMPNGGAQAFFTANALGSSWVDARKACKPAPGRICPLLVQDWHVNVKVEQPASRPHRAEGA